MLRMSVSVNYFEIDITSCLGWNLTMLAHVARKERSACTEGKLIFKDISEDALVELVCQLFVEDLKLIHNLVFARA